MASAEGESECTELLTEALINAQIHNSYTMDEFKELFPRKYRDHKDVKVLYEAYQRKRKQTRDRVRKNIRSFCRQRDQQDDAYDSKHEDEAWELEQREVVLQEEINSMQQYIDELQDKLGSCADALEKRKFFSGLHATDFDVNKFKEKNW
ncbi:uncharacterized protein LOC113672704 isoform X1 [Pocillopora damicornis]|nr:uncharacterized protein LOC113672704 isoform X1 [Pocillopora damicornis]